MQKFQDYMKDRAVAEGEIGIFKAEDLNALLGEVGKDVDELAQGLEDMTDDAEFIDRAKPENIEKARDMIEKNRYSFEKLLFGAWYFVLGNDEKATDSLGAKVLKGFTSGSTLGGPSRQF